MSTTLILAMCISVYIAGALITMLIGFYLKVKHHDKIFGHSLNENHDIYWSTFWWPLLAICGIIAAIIYPIYKIGESFVSIGPKFETWLNKPKPTKSIDEVKSSYRRIVMK
ncbi:hypothetical protein UFOVP1290_201 [uncultured Caudovirales phage]|uniref:Uncharacterized protein n=1 Tax=uncultured Caudovirales phage TaxID=2100421 RepID=A0A6J5RSW0_9CAUD|nr:hypothetical protein UFOVP1290_201 [uncultured Caudovirales phage]